MNRRDFVRVATAAVLAPAAVSIAPAAPLLSPRAVDHFFVDERFADARPLAAAAGGLALTSVHGDVTEIWASALARATREAPLVLRGVTTESFFFCLDVLSREHAVVRTQIARVSPDLHLWTLETLPRNHG